MTTTAISTEVPNGAPLLAAAEESTNLLPRNDSHLTAVSLPPFKLTSTAMYCMLLLFLVEMYDFITIGPLVALFECSICRTYYALHDPDTIQPDGSVEESLCKVDDIQAELAILRGWKLAFDTIPGAN